MMAQCRVSGSATTYCTLKVRLSKNPWTIGNPCNSDFTMQPSFPEIRDFQAANSGTVPRTTT